MPKPWKKNRTAWWGSAEASTWPEGSGRFAVINYEEELKKFKPSLDVDEAEGAIYSRDLTDVIDILQEMLKETSGSRKESAETGK